MSGRQKKDDDLSYAPDDDSIANQSGISFDGPNPKTSPPPTGGDTYVDIRKLRSMHGGKKLSNPKIDSGSRPTQGFNPPKSAVRGATSEPAAKPKGGAHGYTDVAKLRRMHGKGGIKKRPSTSFGSGNNPMENSNRPSYAEEAASKPTAGGGNIDITKLRNMQGRGGKSKPKPGKKPSSDFPVSISVPHKDPFSGGRVSRPKEKDEGFVDVSKLRGKKTSVLSSGSSSKPSNSKGVSFPKSSEESETSLPQTAEEIYGRGAGMGGKPSRGNTIERRPGKKSKDYGMPGSLSIPFESEVSESDSMAASCQAVRQYMPTPSKGKVMKKLFKANEHVLVALNVLDHAHVDEGTETEQSTAIPVNKYGFPQGSGRKKEHLGPWMYVICVVASVHFNEDSVYYIVRRLDNNRKQRADAEWMEHMYNGSDGWKAAMAAAKSKRVADDGLNKFARRSAASKNCSKVASSIRDFFKDQASRFVAGESPYDLEIHITSVKILVLCSIIVAFLDLFKYAFLPKTCDPAVSYIIFVAWIVLVFELIFEVSVRPKNYSGILLGERAYSPRTVRYINRFHLIFESIALVSVIPEFLPIFAPDISLRVNFIGASVCATGGCDSLGLFIAGHLCFLFSRLRLFGLIRHKRNQWINPTDSYRGIENNSLDESNEDKEDESDEDGILRRADTIATALILENSHRMMILLLLITATIPFIASGADGGRNNSVREMTKYLHSINAKTPIDASGDDCDYFKSGVDGWMQAANYPSHVTSLDNDHSHVVHVMIEPARCGYDYTTFCPDVSGESQACQTTSSNITIKDLEKEQNVRSGTLIKVTFPDKPNGLSTTVIYNLSHVVTRSGFNSFMLQSTMLIFILVCLWYLRSDANNLVIAPLRGMLKIVLKYAENPLAGAPGKKDRRGSSSIKDDTFDTNVDGLDSPDEAALDSGDVSKLGSYEMDQLKNAVEKITDLLRKCWGVAGAGIISSNLARNKDGQNTVVFNPTVPGKNVYALFGFAGICDFSHLLRSLNKDVMTLINDVARVVHNEVFRWSFGNSGQCNKNLGASFLLVYRIGDFKEVREKKARATEVIFKETDNVAVEEQASSRNFAEEVKNMQLSTLPGISIFADRAVLGLLKSFAGINREKSVKNWESDYRLGAGVGAFSVEMMFGMDAGWAVEGAVGSSYKIDATYLSSHVNMASRMMCACKQYKLAILISQKVEELLSNAARKVIRHVDTVYVKGAATSRRIYTFDARHKGVDFFLNKRSDAEADKEADNYSDSIWQKDPDLREMRSHVTEDFEAAFKMGLSQYLMGNFSEALVHLKKANEIMIETVASDGRLESVNAFGNRLLDPDTTDEDIKHFRKNIGDGPSQTLIAYIEKQKGVAPPGWHGVRQLTSK